jgi:2-phosphosulfolactate phosphatase
LIPPSSATPFDQRRWACRCDWGPAGLAALAPADVLIIVDVLSFSTCVEIAVTRGAEILPAGHGHAATLAGAHGAELAGRRGASRYSLSPASFLDAPRGLRCVLPSPNGAALTLQAAAAESAVITGCFRNATAVAAAARDLGDSFAVIAAGERWADGSLRLALEDWAGAGAILASLPGTRSPEAEAAIAIYRSWGDDPRRHLEETSSGRELIERGYERDVALAGELDVSSAVPLFIDGAYKAG